MVARDGGFAGKKVPVLFLFIIHLVFVVYCSYQGKVLKYRPLSQKNLAEKL